VTVVRCPQATVPGLRAGTEASGAAP